MMLYKSFITVALAGATFAFTPPGFEPASSNDLTVAFGNTLTVNGVDIPKAETASAPTVGTAEKLFGTYTIMMVDPDIPPQTAGGPTSEFLHWMQSGLISSSTSTTVGGTKFFELVNPQNTTPIASYIQPSPPNKSPTSHRYIQLLLNTTGNGSSLSTLAKFGLSRSNFSAVNVVNTAGLAVLFGNSFNVTAATNTTTSGGGLSASGTISSAGNASATTSGGAIKSTNAANILRGESAMIAILGAFAALVVLL